LLPARKVEVEMGVFDDFGDMAAEQQPLGGLTGLGVGGPAQWLATPRDDEELSRLVIRCRDESIPFRLFGGGSNILLPDAGVTGMVIRTTAPHFQKVTTQKASVVAGAGSSLSELIAECCRASLSGLEDLVAIPGTVGAAVRQNTGDRTGDIGYRVAAVDLMDSDGRLATRHRADIRFEHRQSNLDDVIILGVRFELEEDNPDDIVRRIRKLWIAKKANQPFGFQRSGYVFRNSRGLSASELIDKAAMRGTKVGGAEVCTRDPKFIIANEGATSRDILRLIDLVRSKVEDQTGAWLDLQIDIW
jgi:UDP-N-acetylmuramate dehydrogenase